MKPNKLSKLSSAWSQRGLMLINPFAITPANLAPALSSATVDAAGTSLTLVFSASVTVGAGGNGGWAITPSGGAASLTYASGSGSTSLVYTLGRSITSGETATVAYTQPGNGIEATTGGLDVLTIASAGVTNSSTNGGGFARTQIATYAFPDAVGTHPAAFTDLNAFSGQIRVVAGATFHESFSTASSDSRITAGTYSNDHFFSIVLSGIAASTSTGATSDEIGGVLRASGDTAGAIDMYRVYMRNDVVPLFRCDKVVNGVPTNIFSANASFANGNRLEGEIKGTTINMLKDGVLLHSFTDATLSTGRPGVFAHQGNNDLLRGGSYIDGDVA